MSDKFLIQTSDEATAQRLRDEGLVELEKQGKFYIFINENKLAFSSNVDQSKLNYTNKLCI